MRAFDKINNTWLIFFIAIMSTMSLPMSATAQEGSLTIYVKVQVDGLSCPFCAYGLEKNIKKIEGAKDVFISVAKGYTTFQIVHPTHPSKAELTKIVENAGFTARDVKFSKTPFTEKKEEED